MKKNSRVCKFQDEQGTRKMLIKYVKTMLIVIIEHL